MAVAHPLGEAVKLYVEPQPDTLNGGDLVDVWRVVTQEGDEVVSCEVETTALAIREFLEACEVETVAEARSLVESHEFDGLVVVAHEPEPHWPSDMDPRVSPFVGPQG
jgi:hypothetical protein